MCLNILKARNVLAEFGTLKSFYFEKSTSKHQTEGYARQNSSVVRLVVVSGLHAHSCDLHLLCRLVLHEEEHSVKGNDVKESYVKE